MTCQLKFNVRRSHALTCRPAVGAAGRSERRQPAADELGGQAEERGVQRADVTRRHALLVLLVRVLDGDDVVADGRQDDGATPRTVARVAGAAGGPDAGRRRGRRRALCDGNDGAVWLLRFVTHARARAHARTHAHTHTRSSPY